MKNLYYRFLKRRESVCHRCGQRYGVPLQTSDTAELYCWRFRQCKKEIGDYYRNETNVPIREFNPVKDASDTEIAIRLAMTLGAKEILILGATGGELIISGLMYRALQFHLKQGLMPLLWIRRIRSV